MINQSLMKSLKKRYGADAKRIYYSMENENHAATKKKAINKSIKDHPSWYKKPVSKIQSKIKKSIKKK